MNRSETARRVHFSASGPDGLGVTARDLDVPATGIASATIALRLPAPGAQNLQGRVLPVTIEVSAPALPGLGPALAREASTFVVPQ